MDGREPSRPATVATLLIPSLARPAIRCLGALHCRLRKDFGASISCRQSSGDLGVEIVLGGGALLAARCSLQPNPSIPHNETSPDFDRLAASVSESALRVDSAETDSPMPRFIETIGEQRAVCYRASARRRGYELPQRLSRRGDATAPGLVMASLPPFHARPTLAV